MHNGVTVSGTYYVAVPEGAGRLWLEDPRGRLKPFGRDIAHTPRPGELLLWPSWLRHGVTPNMNTTHPRISLSFNYNGGCRGDVCWERTADVAAAFPRGSLQLGATSLMGSKRGL